MKPIVFLVVVAAVATSGFAQRPDNQRRALRPRRPLVMQRAEAPKQWDKLSQSVFAEDAFSLLGDKKVVIPPPLPAPPKPAPQRPFDRSAVMKELEKAAEAVIAILADEKRFNLERNDFEKNMKSLIDSAESLVRDESEYKDDDTYMELARSLHAKAKDIPDTIKSAGFGEAGKDVSSMKQVCNDCHHKYL